MEFEKQIYQTHSFFLSFSLVRFFVKLGSFIFPILSILGFCALLMLHINQQMTGLKLQETDLIDFDNETVYNFNITNSNNENLNQNFKYAQSQSLLQLQDEFLNKYNFTQKTIMINGDKYWSGLNSILQYTTNIECFFLIDLIHHMNGSAIQILDMQNNISYIWEKSYFEEYYANTYSERIYNTVLRICRCIIGLFFQCITASIYFRMLFIYMPVFSLIIIGLIFCRNHQELQILARSYPWINHYFHILTSNNKLKNQIIDSFLQTLYMFLLIFGLTWAQVNSLLFKKQHSFYLIDKITQHAFSFEYFSLHFLRTRSSLYFVPKYCFIIRFFLYYYMQCTLFGHYQLVQYISLFGQLGVFCYFIHKFEIPALNWSDRSPYTPTINRPRAYYVPLFPMSWINDTPQLWSMFYPLYGRRYFQIQNLALVDQNFPLLNQILEQEIQQGLEIPQDQEVQIEIIQQIQIPQDNPQNQIIDQQQQQQQQQQQEQLLNQIEQVQVVHQNQEIQHLNQEQNFINQIE
ncbi:unnamed protein product [Paramecium pentaurelia]|uniref:Transmembrane protein n=1 Tax=Paramecium pentaurelia TaxID=43138 RepID=A0A8S1UCU7_9CILI|nr:unnamed protein product [Paramecium pentaurelia]